ncbi:aminotransferase class I/II-fold pyridoxal phosphate-dependent enzyme [Paeniglutamicibacter terrestris]|uniref:8-amino-7-oxononanoate synthase n=1 Tax=Paeniglutamicibacter terrestris TaxID=2723403 RepID=A0ABX1G020_9MICC|nr:aminotransferase class I/II-fold pyridoxal phosphate-dependent enzyme [Paeniglutamicibacter terrestris]ASN38223.1 8-amino-7-oxononanoate synthase [Arthrobacter sp. 7749]NKG19567.1 aminotransferase class I/II-fold pyridoxal phosphate-dependent enzyme [Paeniglutamicibacter terrestris]
METNQSFAAETAPAAPTSPWDRWLGDRARVRAARGLHRVESSRDLLMDLASNDYLGLSGHPGVRAAAADALHRYGAGAAASRVATGTLSVHRELEAALCRYTGRPAALVYSSGYTANLGLLQALGGPGSLFILDAHAHASLIDGARLSGARVATAVHNDLADLERLLEENRDSATGAPRVAVVLESVYSVLGDAAPLAAAAELCARHQALLVIDEAHSLAATAQGSAVRAAGLTDCSHVLATATLSKALGAQGGAVLLGGGQARALREHLVNTSRTFLFDTALAPAAAGAAIAALELADAERLSRLGRNARLVHDTLAADPRLRPRIEQGAGAVHSVMMPDAASAVRAAASLRARGVAVACFRPPSVPDGVSRLRITAHADHEPGALLAALHTIARIILEEES